MSSTVLTPIGNVTIWIAYDDSANTWEVAQDADQAMIRLVEPIDYRFSWYQYLCFENMPATTLGPYQIQFFEDQVVAVKEGRVIITNFKPPV